MHQNHFIFVVLKLFETRLDFNASKLSFSFCVLEVIETRIVFNASWSFHILELIETQIECIFNWKATPLCITANADRGKVKKATAVLGGWIFFYSFTLNFWGICSQIFFNFYSGVGGVCPKLNFMFFNVFFEPNTAMMMMIMMMMMMIIMMMKTLVPLMLAPSSWEADRLCSILSMFLIFTYITILPCMFSCPSSYIPTLFINWLIDSFTMLNSDITFSTSP